MRTRLGPPGFQALEFETPNQTNAFGTTSVKLEIPRFDGKEALSWIFKIKQFFDFHGTPEAQHLNIASFYMEGEALTWFQWMHSNGMLLSWQAFLHALEIRFAPSQYDDPKGALFKLCQTATVKEYQSTFESLANRIVGLPHEFYMSCFISGLKPEIRREVQVFQPLSLAHAINLAKLQEEKFNDKPPYNRRPENTTPASNQRPSRPILSSTSNNTSASSSNQPNTAKQPPIKRLSPTELQSR